MKSIDLKEIELPLINGRRVSIHIVRVADKIGWLYKINDGISYGDYLTMNESENSITDTVREAENILTEQAIDTIKTLIDKSEI